jgi:hypothetical protein
MSVRILWLTGQAYLPTNRGMQYILLALCYSLNNIIMNRTERAVAGEVGGQGGRQRGKAK